MTFLNAKLARRGLAAALLACTSVLAVSCVGIWELDGYAGALDDLCEKLRVCFGDEYFPECEAHGEPRITTASAEERQTWLESFADRHCLESCANARACLDMRPVCGEFGFGCAQKEQCCGFLTGATECAADRCCSGQGKACGSANDCCDPSRGCTLDVQENEVVCGGLACIDAHEPCNTNEQCCSGICDPVSGTCAQEICLPDGSRCQGHLDCCSLHCDRTLGDGDGGVCLPPSCIPDGLPCDDPSGLGCCSPYCVVNQYTSEAVCSSNQCLPVGQLCGDDVECCSAFCDPEFQICMETCGLGGDPCSLGCCPQATCGGANGTCCLLDFASCFSNEECCGGVCRDFVCESGGNCGVPGDMCSTSMDCCSNICDTVNQTCCKQTDCHDECVPGGPLSELCPAPTDNLSITCITAVCLQMPSCCCDAWGPGCVAAVESECSKTCPAPAVELDSMSGP